MKRSARARRSPGPRTTPKTNESATARARRSQDTARDAARWRVAAIALLAAYGAALAAVVLLAHGTPSYGAEGDLMGVYIPAARALRAGRLVAEHYGYHGIGYPALLAVVGGALHGDDWLAARILNVGSTVAAAWLTFRLASGLWSVRTGVFAMLALLVTPTFMRAAVEAGTDMPTLALSLAATLLVMRGATPWTAVGSGLLAGLAIVTRYNAVFLPLAGVASLMSRPAARRWTVAYLAALLLPVGAWIAINRHLTGAVLSNQNYSNVAYEFFGRSVPWERFWIETGAQFHSFGEIVAYDPRRFFAHLGANLATRWWQDANQLMGPWIGYLAVPGLVLMLRGRPGARLITLHGILAYAVLAFTFYTPRFFLYLLPIYLSGAAALLLETFAIPWREPRGARLARMGLLAVMLAASGVQAVRETRGALGEAPIETRRAGEWLRAQGLTGRILARKPNVAYFAGMDFVSLPEVMRLGDLLRAGRAAHADFLFLSPVELGTRPQFAPLLNAPAPIPGFSLLRLSVEDPHHGFAIFRLTAETASDHTLDSALVAASEHCVAMPGATNQTRFALAQNLLTMGRAQEAIAPLAAAENVAPRDPWVARWQATVYLELPDYQSAADACRRAMTLGDGTVWTRGHLGIALLMLERASEALDLLRGAVEGEPANAEYVKYLAIAYYLTGDLPAALRIFERWLTLEPRNETSLYYTARILTRTGQRAQAAAVLARNRPAAGFTLTELSALADSLGVARGK